MHKSKNYSLIILLSVVLLSQDYMRWQPWVYMYMLIFWIVSRAKKNNSQQLIWALQLLMAGIYFWVGGHNYASFKLYTGNDSYMFVIVCQSGLNSSLKQFKPYQFNKYKQLNTQFKLMPNDKIISLYHWSIGTYHLPLNLNNSAQQQLTSYFLSFNKSLKQPVRFIFYKKGQYNILRNNH